MSSSVVTLQHVTITSARVTFPPVCNTSRVHFFFLQCRSILKASEKLRPSLEGLIPKLFRYKHDPDPKIRASMQDLWNNLMTDHKT
eukprot:1259883-Amorphochlora_amoeboformis.AAC.1